MTSHYTQSPRLRNTARNLCTSVENSGGFRGTSSTWKEEAKKSGKRSSGLAATSANYGAKHYDWAGLLGVRPSWFGSMFWFFEFLLRPCCDTVSRLTLSALLFRYATFSLGILLRANELQTSTQKHADKAKKNLDEKYSYLAGNAFGRDKKGRVKRDDPGEMHTGGEGAGAEYTPYVYYEFEFN